MTTLREAAQQALEQLKINRTNFRKGPSKSICKMLAGGNDEAIADLEAALEETVQEPVANEIHGCHGGDGSTLPEQPVQEPVAWINSQGDLLRHAPESYGREDEKWTSLYTVPPQRKPLTDEEIQDCWQQRHRDKATERRLITRAIERAHGIGGGDEPA